MFDASVAKLSDDEANILVEEWQRQRALVPLTISLVADPFEVPSLQTNFNKEVISSPLALYLCGYVAVEKYSIMSTE